MTVHRTRPLPRAANRGRLFVAAAIADETLQALRRFRGNDGRHEGLVFWLGRRQGNDTLVLSLTVPPSDHGPQHVFIAERDVGPMSRRARAAGMAVVAQVHSHPGSDTRHSDGDDELILMPVEGMFSLVISSYGDGHIEPNRGAGLHQYQDQQWVQVPHDAGALVVVPTQLR